MIKKDNTRTDNLERERERKKYVFLNKIKKKCISTDFFTHFYWFDLYQVIQISWDW